jgi:hypothetical protein
MLSRSPLSRICSSGRGCPSRAILIGTLQVLVPTVSPGRRYAGTVCFGAPVHPGWTSARMIRRAAGCKQRHVLVVFTKAHPFTLVTQQSAGPHHQAAAHCSAVLHSYEGQPEGIPVHQLSSGSRDYSALKIPVGINCQKMGFRLCGIRPQTCRNTLNIQKSLMSGTKIRMKRIQVLAESGGCQSFPSFC